MEKIKLDISRVYDFISADEVNKLAVEAISAQRTLYNGDGDGNDFLGWLKLPFNISDQQLTEIEEAVSGLKEKTELLVVVGIGGSYLGARAVNDALANNFAQLKREPNAPHMLFAGHNIGEDYMHEMLELLDNYDYSIVVISKSGTTTEPAIAFRILKDHLVKKVGIEKARERISKFTLETRREYAGFISGFANSMRAWEIMATEIRVKTHETSFQRGEREYKKACPSNPPAIVAIPRVRK